MSDTTKYIADKIADSRLASELFGDTTTKTLKKIKQVRNKAVKMHTVYIYSTDTLKRSVSRDDGTKSWPPRGKLGQTFLGNGDVRISQQDGTFSFEQPEPLAKMDVPVWITDHDIRKKVCSYSKDGIGINYSASRIDKDREWVDFYGESNEEDMVRIWKEAINDLWYKVRQPNACVPYLYQEELIEKVIARFLAGSKDVLLAAIMRSGKCLMTYQIAKRMGFKRILIITGKTGVNDSWNELLPRGPKAHIDYTDWTYHNYNSYKKSSFQLSGADTDVLFTSLQYLKIHIDANTPDPEKPNKQIKDLPQTVKDILSTDWDMVVYDEQHWATQTDSTLDLLNSKLKFKFKLELSGTAYKTLIQGRYDTEDIIAFDYVDEQYRRFNGTLEEQKALEYRPDIDYLLIGISQKVKDYILAEEAGFSFAKLFAVSKGQKTFKNNQAVTEFLSFVYKNAYKNQYNGKLAKFAPYVANINRHTLWVLPDTIKGIAALENELAKHPIYSKWKVINGSGSNVKGIDEVVKIINDVDAGKYEGKTNGTITLTCGRFLEGTTVPKWWCVHQMNDDKSASDYFQGCFRAKSEDRDNDKRHVLVYDYCPERFLQATYNTNIDSMKKSDGKSTGDVLREWRECAGVFDFDGINWNSLSGKELMERMNKSIELRANMFGNINLDKSKINLSIRQLMQKINAKKSWQATTVVTANGTPTTPDHNSPEDPNQPPAPPSTLAPSVPPSTQEELDKEIREIIEKFRNLCNKIPNVIWASYGRKSIGSFEDVCTYNDPEFIADHTGLIPSEWTIFKSALPIGEILKIDRRIDSTNEWYKNED
jgi:predicted lipoprotein with Yx(FWY)xxD motif